jgi:hypothetical protein
MEKNTKYIIREVPPEQSNFSFYFDDDCFTGAGGDYCYNLFIKFNTEVVNNAA